MNFKIGISQMKVNSNKEKNLEKVKASLSVFGKNDVNLGVLPECWNCPYGVEYFEEYSEEINNSKSIELMSELAKENNLYLIGGTIPIKEDGKIYNTCFCFNNKGEIIGKYSKIHLFDIDLGNFSFKESDVLTAGSKPLIIETPYCKIGIGICYDLRFPLLADYYAKNGCNMIVYPGSFSEKTGPIHWSLLLKGRALDNQCYVIGCSTSKNDDFNYKGYGHSSIVDPWGNIMYEADGDSVCYVRNIDMKYLEEIRNKIPVLKNTREII